MDKRTGDVAHGKALWGSSGHHGPAPLRLVAALGDPERESELLPSISECGEFDIVERCLGADQLLATLVGGRVDVALFAGDLHRLNEAALASLAGSGVPLVVLARQPADERWQELPALALPAVADAGAVREALLVAAAGRGSHAVARTPRAKDTAKPRQGRPVATPSVSTLIALAGGHGSPGRTTVAVNLAIALGAVAPTALVDADLAAPSVAAYLDADPTRNLYMLAHAEPSTPQAWEKAIAQECQPLGHRSPYGVVLCGLPRPQARASLSPRLGEHLLAALGERYRYVVVDLGADLLGPESQLTRAVLGRAGKVLLVAAADLVGLWRTRLTLALLEGELGIAHERVALVVNRHDRRYHHGRQEIEWALGIPVAAVIPHDHTAAQRALAEQRPLVLGGRGKAARALLDLSERLHGADLALPTEEKQLGRGWLGRLLPSSRPTPSAKKAKEGMASDGNMASAN